MYPGGVHTHLVPSAGLPHVLVRLKQHDVDFGREEAEQGHRRTDGDADTKAGQLNLPDDMLDDMTKRRGLLG